MNQNAIWGRLQDDDQKVLKELFDLHYKPLCGFLLQYTKDSDIAEDIVQSVFVELWEKRARLVIRQSVKSYLYRAVYNTFIDKIRHNKRNHELLDRLKYEAVLATIEEDDSIYNQKINKLKAEIEALPPRCKEILLLSKMEGYKYCEIANQLDISVKTVEAQMRLAFQKIREGFEDEGLFLFMFFKNINYFFSRKKIK